MAAAGRRTLLSGRCDLLRLETAAVQPRDLASLRARRQRLPCLRRAVLRDPAAAVSPLLDLGALTATEAGEPGQYDAPLPQGVPRILHGARPACLGVFRQAAGGTRPRR